MVSFVPAIATGLLFSEVVYAGSAVEVMEPILDHRNQVLLSAGLLALAWLVRRRRPEGACHRNHVNAGNARDEHRCTLRRIIDLRRRLLSVLSRVGHAGFH